MTLFIEEVIYGANALQKEPAHASMTGTMRLEQLHYLVQSDLYRTSSGEISAAIVAEHLAFARC
jgi:hypothetical protein